MSNFIGLVYATLKNKGVDYSNMSVSEAVDKFNELKGNTAKQKETESKAKSGVLDSIREKSLQHSQQASWGNSGYQGGMSKRAVSAYEGGEMPWSKWSKAAIIEAVLDNNDDLTAEDLSRLKLNDLRDMFLASTSWHHTGKFYNRTDFYGIKDNVSKMTREDFYREVKSNWEQEEYEKDVANNPELSEQVDNVWEDVVYGDTLKTAEGIIDKVSDERREKYLEFLRDYEKRIKDLKKVGDELQYGKDIYSVFADEGMRIYHKNESLYRFTDNLYDIYHQNPPQLKTPSHAEIWVMLKKGMSKEGIKAELRKQAEDDAEQFRTSSINKMLNEMQEATNNKFEDYERTLNRVREKKEFGKQLEDIVKQVTKDPVTSIFTLETGRYKLETVKDTYIIDYNPLEKKPKGIYKFAGLVRGHKENDDNFYQYRKYSKEPTYEHGSYGIYKELKGEKIA